VFAQIVIKPLEVTQKAEEKDVEEEDKDEKEKKPEKKDAKIGVVSMCMDPAGKLVFAGCTDKTIRVYEINEQH